MCFVELPFCFLIFHLSIQCTIWQTRVLVSHNLAILPECDWVLLLQEGRVVEQGTYKTLLQQGGQFAAFVVNHIAENLDGGNQKGL